MKGFTSDWYKEYKDQTGGTKSSWMGSDKQKKKTPKPRRPAAKPTIAPAIVPPAISRPLAPYRDQDVNPAWMEYFTGVLNQQFDVVVPIHPVGYTRRVASDARYTWDNYERKTAKIADKRKRDNARAHARAVLRYKDYKKELKQIWAHKGYPFPNAGVQCTFLLRMNQTSWSRKKKNELFGQPHMQKPDVDNLLKAFMDAIVPDDSTVWHLGGPKKLWFYSSFICVNYIDAPAKRPYMLTPSGLYK